MSRLRDETGAAMAITIMILAIVTLSVGAAVSVAVDTNAVSIRDAKSKQASEAAEAGLQVALYRLNMLRPDDAHCIGDVVATPGATGTCTSSVTSIGNGASYQYYMTPTMGSGAACIGVTLGGITSISQRCITSVGISNGVTQRTQIRASAFGAQPLFPVNGIVGLKSLSDSNNASISGWEASNGPITASNNVSITGQIELGPAGTYSYSNGASNPPKVVLTSPIVLAPVAPGTSNQSSLANCPARQTAGFPACNDNYRISNYLNNPSSPTSPYDQSSGGVTYNAATRALSMGNNASLTLGGGLYNFCSFSASNNVTINLAPGVKTEIFIDSPDNPGSGCPAGSGTIAASNNVTWMNLSQDPTSLQIYVYGLNDGTNVVNFSNNGVFYGVLYAPQSTINLSNNAAFWGAISGNVVNLSNNTTFNWGASAGTLQATTTGLYYRSGWAQCSPTAPANTPGASCG
ncbi:MAG: DUF7305 domain-containing protein [Solirubrobacteraceae bacterium]